MSTTGTRTTRALGGLAVAGVAVLVLLGLVVTLEDVVQGDAVRVMYIHVPSAWTAYLAFGVTAVCSALYLIPRTRSMAFDRVAGASAEVGVLFTGLAIVTGMLWGRITWGVFWTWDARLTTTALLFVLYLGYLALRRLPALPEQRARRAAIAGLIMVINVPIVHQSVEWWDTLHQEPTIARKDLDPQIDGLMLFTVMFGLAVFTLVYAWMVLHRHRQLWLEDHAAESDLDVALEARRREAHEVGAG